MRNEDDEEEQDFLTLIPFEEIDSNELEDATDSYFSDSEENNNSTQNE